MSDLSRGLAGLLLSAAVSGAAERGRADATKPERSIEEDLASLRAACERYQGGLSFKPGDLVTPRRDSPLKDAGRPHIVLDVEPEAEPLKVGNTNAMSFGERLDMRVACTCSCDHGEIRAHWVESWMFEPWTPPAPEAAAAEEPAPATEIA